MRANYRNKFKATPQSKPQAKAEAQTPTIDHSLPRTQSNSPNVDSPACRSQRADSCYHERSITPTHIDVEYSKISLWSSCFSRRNSEDDDDFHSSVDLIDTSEYHLLQDLDKDDFIYNERLDNHKESFLSKQDQEYLENHYNQPGQFRNRFINSLKNMEILPTMPKSKCQAIVIIDWETLYSGSNLEQFVEEAQKNMGRARNFKTIKEEKDEKKVSLKTLDKTASKLLSKAVEHGDCYITTNYSESVAKYNMKLYLPLTYKVAAVHGVNIISTQHYEDVGSRDSIRNNTEESYEKKSIKSARSSYDIGAFKETSAEMKAMEEEKKGFRAIRRKLCKGATVNLLAIANSEAQVDRMKKFGNDIGAAPLKILRLPDYPKVEELIKQQHVLVKEFDKLFFSLKSTTVGVARKSSVKRKAE